MKKISFLIIILLIVISSMPAQNIENFSFELSDLKNKYREALNDITDVDELDEIIEDINGDAENLERNFEDYIEDYIEDESLNKNNYQSLYNEIREFYSFTDKNNTTCDCLKYFNKFISEFGGTRTLIKEQDGVKIMVAEIGNFKYYYVYSIYNHLYRLIINMTKQGGYHNHNFGLGGEVEVFCVVKKQTYLKLSKFNVTKTEYSGYQTVKCNNEFPRN